MTENNFLPRITDLIEKSLRGEATDEEYAELHAFLSKEEYAELVDELIYQSFYKDIVLSDINEQSRSSIFESIVTLDKKQIPVKRISYWKWVSVASIFILLLGTLFFYYEINDNKELVSLSSSITKTNKIDNPSTLINPTIEALPAQDEALFINSKGISIRLEELEVGDKKTFDGITIEKKSVGDIVFVYHSDVKESIATNQFNTIVTPRGSKYKITLPDLTEVDLNSNSKLTFPVLFSGDVRSVSLEGEAYFHVHSDLSKKFIVQLRSKNTKHDVVVYGTKFNINSYPESNSIITTLIDGSVKIIAANQELFLKPNEQSVFFNNELEVSLANVDVNLAWVNNLFYFVDEPLEIVMKQISQWYDIDVVYQSEIPSIRLWGQISRSKKLEEILTILEQTNDLKFQVDGKEVLVMK